jgi:GNAT superfamily N-acetyltransferase
MPGSLPTRTWLKVRYYWRSLPVYGFVVRVLIDGLAKLGLRIEPYYLMVEGIKGSSLPPPIEALAKCEFGFLGPQDMKAIAAIPDRQFSEEDLMGRLEEGKKCFGAKYRGAVVAFSWCNFTECAFEMHRLFSLRDDEAYLFDAYTVEAFRGKGIAPYLRSCWYQELEKVGRTKCYSITVALNAAAAQFKNKLQAQVVELRVFVEVLRTWRFHSSLWKYRNVRFTS